MTTEQDTINEEDCNHEGMHLRVKHKSQLKCTDCDTLLPS